MRVLETRIPDDIDDTFLKLARERRLSLDQLLGMLVQEEDRRRHIDPAPLQYGGGLRMKCNLPDCQETRERWSSLAEEQRVGILE